MSNSSQVLFASRISVGLKDRLTRFCEDHGVKMNFFISRAIQERLERLAEDEADIEIIKSIEKDAEFVGQDVMDAYIKKRFAKR